MKGYLLLLLIIAAILLLLPLPALSHTKTPTAPPNDSASTPSTPAENAPTDNSDTTTFRILTGDTVITLTTREFLIRTLAFEMPAAYHTEALKAQAVAAYTYYSRRKDAAATTADPALKGADFRTPDASFPQEYTTDKLRDKWGAQFDSYYHKLCAAVDAVMGKCILYEGNKIDAAYFAISHGTTEPAEAVWGAPVPYLQSITSPGDKLAPGYEQSIKLSTDEVKAAITKTEPTITLGDKPEAWFGQPTNTAAGSVATIPVGDKTLAGTAVRAALGLRSACFSVTYTDGTFTFVTRGYGHGVGMSQYGADYLARQGYTWQEILHYYYTNVTIA